jgi:hypothetical protein
MHKKIIKIVIAVAVTGSVFAGAYYSYPKISNRLEVQKAENLTEESVEEAKENTQGSHYLEVPFICQAPLQTNDNWKFHEESCEEAAVLQSYLFLTDQTMSKQQAHEEILKMIDWQMEHFGGHHDIYAAEVKEFINGYYNIPNEEIEVIYDSTLEDIKTHISQGYPVIVPIMGDVLQNPHYPHPGYHMLAAIGYTQDTIITNDNGTRKGADFSYKNQRFLDAMNAAGGDIVVIKARTTNF